MEEPRIDCYKTVNDYLNGNVFQSYSAPPNQSGKALVKSIASAEGNNIYVITNCTDKIYQKSKVQGNGTIICFRSQGDSRFHVYKFDKRNTTSVFAGCLANTVRGKLSTVCDIVNPAPNTLFAFHSKVVGGGNETNTFLTDCYNRENSINIDELYLSVKEGFGGKCGSRKKGNQLQAVDYKKQLAGLTVMYDVFDTLNKTLSKQPIDVLSVCPKFTQHSPNLYNEHLGIAYSEGRNGEIIIDVGVDRIIDVMRGAKYSFD